MEKILLLDCDGVMADFVQGLRDAITRDALEKEGWVPLPNGPLTYELSEWLSPELMAVASKAMEKEEFWDTLNPLPLMHLHFEALAKQFDRVLVVTAPYVGCPTWEGARRRWLKTHYGIKHDQVLAVPSRSKQFVMGTVFIDDHTKTLDEWQKRNPLGLAMTARCSYTSHESRVFFEDYFNLDV